MADWLDKALDGSSCRIYDLMDTHSKTDEEWRSVVRAAHEKEVADLKARAGLLNERIADLEADNLELQERVERLEAETYEYDTLTTKQAALLTKIINILRGTPPESTLWSHHDIPDCARSLKEQAEALQARVERSADKEAEVTNIAPTGTEGAKLSEYGVAKLIAEHFDMKESPVQIKDGAFLRRNFKINIIDTERERYFELRVWSEGHE